MSSKKDELRWEYPPDLIKSGVRGKYAERHREEGTNLVLIDSDLRELFPDSAAVTKRSETTQRKRRRSAT